MMVIAVLFWAGDGSNCDLLQWLLILRCSRTVNPDGNLPEENKKVEADTYTVTANPLQWDPVQEHLEKIEDFLLEILNLRVRRGYDRYGSDVSGDLFCCVFVLVHCVVTRYYAYMSVPTPSSSVNKTFVLLNTPFVLLGVTFRNERSSDCDGRDFVVNTSFAPVVYQHRPMAMSSDTCCMMQQPDVVARLISGTTLMEIYLVIQLQELLTLADAQKLSSRKIQVEEDFRDEQQLRRGVTEPEKTKVAQHIDILL
ncbi:hypothetical protein T4E_5444 [Trichinella pseudospiralis]|uniref:Uncharacterized protein n=1 Tax=Trichinella pseudospiralis TaxID=6337 RepID=A0A0V0XFL1_TRIPS|nr:hypothetical protein T4E_5444 [Trichinella pseudospiralis]